MSRMDVVIIGGGPAGMSAALVAGRGLLNATVVNAEAPRNAVTTASHGFLTRDGAHPSELLEVSKEQLQKYPTVRYLRGRARSVHELEGGFEVELADGTTLASDYIVIATGYKDDLGSLNLAGIEAVYGKTVYPCAFCDGFEHRGERLAVFSNSGEDYYVPIVRMWSNDVALFTNGAPVADERKESLQRRGVLVYEERIAKLVAHGGKLLAVELASGIRVERDAGFISDDYAISATEFAENLGVSKATNDWGLEVLEVDSSGRTSVPGVRVIGDARSGFGGLVASAAEGAACMEAIVHEIASARWTEDPDQH